MFSIFHFNPKILLKIRKFKLFSNKNSLHGKKNYQRQNQTEVAIFAQQYLPQHSTTGIYHPYFIFCSLSSLSTCMLPTIYCISSTAFILAQSSFSKSLQDKKQTKDRFIIHQWPIQIQQDQKLQLQDVLYQEKQHLSQHRRHSRNQPINILINNAGMLLVSSPAGNEISAEKYDLIMSTNLESCYHLSQLAYRFLKSSGMGNIVFNSSVSSLKTSLMDDFLQC